jgi:hypothetical protein
MNDHELDGIRNIIEAQNASNEARRRQYEVIYTFWGGKPPPYKFSRRVRLGWWWRDQRRRIAEWIYPEGRDDYWH